MPTKVKARTGGLTIVRHGSLAEQNWFINMCVNLRDKEMKKSPITSVQNMKGDEIVIPQMKPIMQPVTIEPKTTNSGAALPFSGASVTVDKTMEKKTDVRCP